MTLARTARAVLDGFILLRCPICHRGRLFPGPFTYRLNQVCPHCGARFMPDTGEVAGGMVINMVTTSILGVACVVYLTLFTKLPAVWAVAVLVGAPTLFALWFHRRAHGLWVAMLHLTRNMEEPHPRARARTQARVQSRAQSRVQPPPAA
jgi:uncharacterized protein (DUF983 family)